MLPVSTLRKTHFREFSERTRRGNKDVNVELDDFVIDQTHPLPPLPKKTYQLVNPTKFVTDVLPLYKRGWSFQPVSLPDVRAVSALRKRFAFASDGDVFDFISDLRAVIEQEKHHPTVEFCYDKMSITLFSHTAWYTTPGSPENPRTKAFTQGVSLRDVRFAHLVEELFLQYLSRSGFQFTPFNVPCSERPVSLSHLHDHHRHVSQE
ncbi:hypothetical protein OF83DRAFT_1170442 [Amylostereum chailletii]|nr:hypothetical protein OF83DRAFT_1170442 [Amylostereum chailletii]